MICRSASGNASMMTSKYSRALSSGNPETASIATWFWWLLARTRPRRGEAVVALFLSTLPMTVLGVGLLLSKTPWYASYRDVTDQQVAGAVMWAVGGGIAVAQGVALFVVWLASVERTSVTPAEVGSA